MPLTSLHRRDILSILEHALRAVEPRQAVLQHMTLDGDRLMVGDQTYDLAQTGRILVAGAGKAGAPMAAAVQQVLGSRVTAGQVNVKHGHLAPAGDLRFAPNPARMPRRLRPPMLRGRPQVAPTGAVVSRRRASIPDGAGMAGAERIVSLLTGLTEHDLVLVLLSGGGSALLPLPVAGVSLAVYRSLTDLLLRSGADITEINTIRKHCSRHLQGGRLAELATPAWRVVSLILSDVVGSPLDAIVRADRARPHDVQRCMGCWHATTIPSSTPCPGHRAPAQRRRAAGYAETRRSAFAGYTTSSLVTMPAQAALPWRGRATWATTACC